MKRKTKQAMKKTAITFFMLGAFVFILFIASTEESQDFSDGQTPAVSNQVLDYEPLVETYADKYGVTEHIDVLMAMMMQESGGRGDDPMQASESLCGSRGCIDDPELSIKQGVRYFAETLAKADGDLELAVQSYNFGQGFIDYVHAHSGDFTQEAAVDFSRTMYTDADDKSDYQCSRDGAEAADACYGDIYYVRDVMAYTQAVAQK